MIASFSGSGLTVNDLVREDFTNTTIDLTVDTAATNGTFAYDSVLDGATINASTVPQHTNPLGGVNGLTIPDDESSDITAVWSDLVPGNLYELYVFAHEADGFTTRQHVSIVGQNSVGFDQVVTTGNLEVNDQRGSSSRSLSEYAKLVTADDSGQINITISQNANSDSINVAALAIREAEFSVQLEGDDLVIQDISDSGDNNALTITTTATHVVINDANQTLTTIISGATGNGTNTVTVPLSAFSGDINVRTGNGDDAISTTTPSRFVEIDARGTGAKSLTVNGTNNGEEYFVEANEFNPLGDTLTVRNGASSVRVEALNVTSFSLNMLSDNDTVNVGNLSILGVGNGAALQNFTIDLGDGDDTLAAISNTNALTVIGGNGADSLQGGSGSDILLGGNENDTIDGGGGDDFLTGDAGNDILLGGDGNDTLTGGIGNDHIGGGTGTDRVIETADSDFLLSNQALDSVTLGNPLGVDILGSIEEADLTGGSSANTIDAGLFQGNVTLSGGGGDDTLKGGIGADSLSGGAGNDTLTGSTGNDTLDGGAGTDRLTQSADTDFTLSDSSLISGVLGTDTLISIEQAELTGGSSANTIDASAFMGSVLLRGEAGNDTLFGGATSSALDGGEGNDSLTGGASGDVLFGFVGNDVLNGGGGNDSLLGEAGDDILTGGTGNDTLDGGSGTDRVTESADASFTLTDMSLTGLGTDVVTSIEQGGLTGGVSANTINAAAFSGNVTLVGGDGNDTLTGGAGDDSLNGGNGNDMLFGQDGNDSINGARGNDTSFGGAGNDFLSEDNDVANDPDSLDGGNGNDTLRGFLGNDTLVGGAGDDSLSGENDNDTLTGGTGNDTLNGGSGTDRVTESEDANFTLTDTSLTGLGTDSLTSIEQAVLTGGASANTIDASAFSGNVTLMGGDGNDTLVGAAGASFLNGNADNDSLTGGASGDTLVGFSGNDVLDGGGGNDSLMGESDDDTLMGGTGNDTLEGGDGDDTYQFDVDTALGSDTVTENASEGTDLLDFTLTTTVGVKVDLRTLTAQTVHATNLTLTLSADIEQLTGGALADTLIGSDSSDTIDGGSGDDSLNGGKGNDMLFGQDGNDSINGAQGNDTSFGGAGDDFLSEDNDVAFDPDSLDGGDGNDTLRGFLGNDTLVGGAGDDSLSGENDNDTLMGGTGSNTLLGGIGDDDLFSVSATDSLDGGASSDFSEFNGVDVTFPTNVAASFFLPETTGVARHDQVRVLGTGQTVTLGNAPLSIDLGSFTPQIGDTFTIVELIDVTSSISGVFSFSGQPLEEGATFNASGQDFQITYQGGDGNDIVLTASLPPDFGDAPDTGAGTGTGNYQTTAADGGPSHAIVSGLFLGASVDGDSGALQNATANADDVDSALPDDEDGVLNPLDLQGTIGAAPTVTLLATNTTGSTATLSGWIDYNGDGVFDNASERATVTVPNGSSDARFTLTFPAIPDGSSGSTYTRFRLSTDQAAMNSFGAATDGEVEDYVFTIVSPSSGGVSDSLTLSSGANGLPSLSAGGRFGDSVTPIGDLNGDGVVDLAVGAPLDGTTGNAWGAVYILFMNASGSVASSVKLTSGVNGGPTLADGDHFGQSVTSLGDLDGDGVSELAVGAIGDDVRGTDRGAVYIFFLSSDGTVRTTTKLPDGGAAVGAVGDVDEAEFGDALTALGDINGDGIPDLLTGSPNEGTPPGSGGTVDVLQLNSDGTVAGVGGFGPVGTDPIRFGDAVQSIGDIDHDGVIDIATGIPFDGMTGSVEISRLGTNGFPASSSRTMSGVGNAPVLDSGAEFGTSLAAPGDLDGDGIADVIVGAPVAGSTGVIYVLFLNADGSVRDFATIDSSTLNVPGLSSGDLFGSSIAAIGDLNGDGIIDLAVGAAGTDGESGALHILFLQVELKSVDVTLPGAGSYEVLRDGADLVVRVEGGGELSRDVAANVSVLQITGSTGDDVVTVLNTGTVVDTPIVFTGGDGNDRFDASLATGVVNLTGNGGDDVLIGGSANDTLNGGSGKDELIGGLGNDLVQGQGSTGDTLDGGDGDDTLNGGSGNDLIRESFTGDATLTNSAMTGRGNDTVISAERAQLSGSGAAQTLDVSAFFTAGLTSVTLDGSGGNDTLLGSDGSDVLNGAGGSDLVNGNGGQDRIFGGSGADTLIGGAGNDLLKGLGGSGDRLVGGEGDDTLNGGRGIDRLTESGDADFTLTNSSLTGMGNDLVQAIEIAEINAGDSDNLIDVSAFFGFRGFVQVRANGGNDTVIGSAGPDVLNGGDGNDILLGKEGNDTLSGDDGNDGLSGADGDDVIDGGRGYDRAFGGMGNDSLAGGNAVDTLIGGNGDDTLAGNDGNDTLVGGQGTNNPSAGDVFNDATATIDEAFQLDPLPAWVDQV
ncbi:hypothetical protein GC176_28270 [bacterium]|nr:hypothetical protein [bacterium]